MIFISILILIVAIALPSFNKQLSPILFTRISSIIFLYAGALSFNALYIQSIGSGIGIYSGLFHVTIISQLLEIFLLIIGSLILTSWPIKKYIISNSLIEQNSVILTNLNYQIQEKNITNKNSYAIEYSLLVLFSTLGASLLVSSSDLISMYLSIELQSFGVYILATLYRESESATSAGLKYFLLGGLSSCIILLGASLIYTYTGLTNFESIYNLISVSDNNNIIQGLNLGLIFIIVGFLFKIAAAPLHNWAPDVYDDSPTIVTIWLTIMPKISILILLLELQTQIGLIGEHTLLNVSSGLELLESITSININNSTSIISDGIILITGENTIYVLKFLLLISSLLSLIIGTVVGLAQTRIKRLLAYSTISHIGFILLALAINTELSIDALIFYIIQYSITNLNTFLIIIAIGYTIQQSINQNLQLETINSKFYYTKNKDGQNEETVNDIKFISELKGQFFSNPLLSLSFTICLFSMAGIPPLIGFFSKQFVLYSAVQNGYYFMAIVAILVSVISASYYLKIIRVLHTEKEEIISDETSSYSILNKESNYTSINNLLTQTEELNTISNKKVKANEENLDSIKNLVNKEDINSTINESNLIETLRLRKNKFYSESLLTNSHSFLISSLTLTILLFVLKPSIILNSTQLLSLSIYNF
jgi:NADH-ubiquinone oxidoreductase chain 2